MERRFEVFISSTFVDLKEEREKVMQAVLKLDCFPAGMELFPASDASQWHVIQRAIDRCDYYVILVAGRYGSLGERNLSYTEQEFDYAVARGIPVLAFVHADPDAIPAGKTDKNDEARKRLEAFREKVSTGRIRNDWLNRDELAAKVTIALVNAFKTDPRPGWIRGTVAGAGRQSGSAEEDPAHVVAASASKTSLRVYLRDKDFRFEELVSDALRDAAASVAEIASDRPLTPMEHLALAEKCEVGSADLSEIAAETAYFGNDVQHDVILAAVEQLCAIEPRGGFVHLNQMRAYPAVLAFYAAGVAAVAKKNLSVLRKFYSLPLSDPGHGKAPALRILSPGYALKGLAQVPRPDGTRLKTPLSDRILAVLKAPVLRLPMMTEKKLEDVFDRFEYLNALSAALTEGAYPYYGRFVWHGRSGLGTDGLMAEFSRELQAQGTNWPPYRDGLLGSGIEAVKAAKVELDRRIDEVTLTFY